MFAGLFARRSSVPVEPTPLAVATPAAIPLLSPHTTPPATAWGPDHPAGVRQYPPLEHHPARQHAARLLRHLHDPEDLEGPFSGPIEQKELQTIYREMCAELWWAERHWSGRQGVAFHFRALTGSRKRYGTAWVGGVKKRPCLYDIPAPAVSARADSGADSHDRKSLAALLPPTPSPSPQGGGELEPERIAA